MRYYAEKLFDLLPAVYRIRDEEAGGPLRALLSVIADQANVLANDLEQFYDDQFVETCAPWVLPYIGDLIGITGLQSTARGTLGARAEVAHTIGYRRRKGTAAMLEQLAHDVTGWPARAVEFFQLLATTQYMNHVRPENRSFIDVRAAARLEYLGTAFEHLAGATDLAHTVDVRRITYGRGRYNIPNIGLFLWRLRAYKLTRSHAVPSAAGDKRRFHFSPLGNRLPLFNLPRTEDEVTHLAEPINVPVPISRRALAGEETKRGVLLHRNLDDYYGADRSFLIELQAGTDITQEPVEVAAGDIIVCDLSGWTHTPPPGKVAVDPVLGRIAFPADQTKRVLVTFHYGFSANIGGGEYDRVNSFDVRLQPVRRVANTPVQLAPFDSQTIQTELNSLVATGGVVEILDSGIYAENLTLNAGANRLELRAADKRRPTISSGADVQITGLAGGEVTLNGLLLTGGQLRITGKLRKVRLLHCTLVPGISLDAEGKPTMGATPSLFSNSPETAIEMDSCITGGLRVKRSASVSVVNSIIDATDEAGVAYADTDDLDAGGALRLTNCTVIGKVHTDVLELASNTIFLAEIADKDKKKWDAPVWARKRQEGCVRFSYLPAGSRVPRRFQCQPERDADAARLRPLLISSHYGDPEYCQLSSRCPLEIERGADDESEMGAFHDLFQPQREAHLTARLDEFLRFGLEAGIFYAT